MGGITRSLFGGGKSKSSQDNQAYPALSGLLTGNVGAGNNAMGTLGALLGLGGDKAAADGAFQNYLGSSGYNFLMDSGRKAINGSAAASGGLRSGATGMRLMQYGQDLASTKLNEYIQQLTGLGKYGLESAGIIGSAGNRSSSVSKDSGKGIFNSLFPG